MKIDEVKSNSRKRSFELRSGSRHFSFPYVKCDPRASSADPVRQVYVDWELANEGFTYVLASGAEGSVMMDQILDYVMDPAFMRKMLLHKLTIEAARCLEESGLSKREVIRRLGTSPAQVYRLLDTANYGKSVDQMLKLLQVLGCEVDFVVTTRPAVRR